MNSILHIPILSYRSSITPSELMNNVSAKAENITSRITLASLSLKDLKQKVDKLNATMQDLKENATKLQEENVEGM